MSPSSPEEGKISCSKIYKEHPETVKALNAEMDKQKTAGRCTPLRKTGNQ